MLQRLRHYFALGDVQLKLYILATLTGVLAGAVIIAFRLFIEQSQIALLPSGQLDGFASLPWYWILGMPILGGLLIGLLFGGLDSSQRSIGVMHVIERLSYHEGRLPLANAIRQFIGAAIALVSGHSVGREGPSVHIGAASGSFLGMNLELPNNGVRLLVASGAAAAIAASFNTPIAGVIFAMEVIMMEYYIATFIPIILAAVSGAVLSRLVFGESPFYGVVVSEMQSLWELPYIILLGVFLGLIAVLFIRTLTFFSQTMVSNPVWHRTTLAGLLVGLGGLLLPDVMGMSYNLINSVQLSELAITGLLLLLLLKLVLSSACVGLGIPGGLIGPTMVIGAAAGAILGHIGQALVPELASSIGFYAMIGMCAMMGATLKAPLAGLMTLIELTANPHTILPGLLAIVFASVIVLDVFKMDSVFLVLLRKKGMDYGNDPLVEALRKIAITKAMQTEFTELPSVVTPHGAESTLASGAKWVIVHHEGQPHSLLAANDLKLAIEQASSNKIDLLNIPATRLSLARATSHISIQDAIERFEETGAEALYINQRIMLMEERTIGVLTRQEIEDHYRMSRF